jgi:hypothetical protein
MKIDKAYKNINLKMKTYKTAFLSVFIFSIFLSCEDEEKSPDQKITDEIIGKWYLSEYQSYQSIAEESGNYFQIGGTIDYSIDFNDNPKVIFLDGKLNYLGGAITQDDTISTSGSFDGSLNQGYHTGKWKIENENLVTKTRVFGLIGVVEIL